MTITKELTLVNKYGMHVRPAGALAKVCQKYASDVTVDGEDADLAMAEIEELVRNHFGIADE